MYMRTRHDYDDDLLDLLSLLVGLLALLGLQVSLGPAWLESDRLAWLGRLASWHALDFEQKTHKIHQKGHLP